MQTANAAAQGGVDANHKTEVRVKKIDPKAIWADEEVEESECVWCMLVSRAAALF